VIELPVAGDGEQRFLVEDRVVWIFRDIDTGWLDRVESATRTWLPFSHPRVSAIHSIERIPAAVAVTVADDRGPELAQAARELTDPIERERWVVAQFITIADALAAMARHKPGFVHQKLEPHRLFVDATGRAKLRAPVETVAVGPQRNMTGGARIVGSPHFMAPEQARGVPSTPATDVFALASNLAYALTGELPFSGEQFMEVLVAIIMKPAPAIATESEALAQVLARAFEKDPAARIADPAAFASELYACVPDAGDYDAVTSDRMVAWWPHAPQAQGENHLFGGNRCQKTWEDLEATAQPERRFCHQCDQSVVQLRSLASPILLDGKRCIAYRGGG
jgi:protein kinase-like protein